MEMGFSMAYYFNKSQRLTNGENIRAVTQSSPVEATLEFPAEEYDIAIIGGGLAGLAFSILSANAGYKVILFEKEEYPFHRVCGEYISMESWNFLEELGLPLIEMNLPIIKRVKVSAPSGNFIMQDLPLGGFGISRYKIDFELSKLAKQKGAHLLERTKVDLVNFDGRRFIVKAGEYSIYAKLCCGAFGKRSNLDIKWKRNFVLNKPNKLNNYVGVKYHVYAEFPDDLISLHNFDGGYCGI